MPHSSARIQAAVGQANRYFVTDAGKEAVRTATSPSELADAIAGTDYPELSEAIGRLDGDMQTAIFHHLKAAAAIGTDVQFLWNDRPGQGQLVATSYTADSPMDIVIHAVGTTPASS